MQKFQVGRGIDLRNDFVAPLGGEYAVTLDSPAVPGAVVEGALTVNDQQHLQQTLERLVELINVDHYRQGKKGLAWARTENGGRGFYTLKSLDYGPEVNYTYAYGYFIAAPSRALVENAIKYEESGHTLLGSPKFKATLPEDKQVSFSVMVYLKPLPGAGPRGQGHRLARWHGRAFERCPLGNRSLLVDKAGLAYVYALNDRMVMSVNSEDRPIGLSPSDLLGLAWIVRLGRIIGGIASH